MTDVVKQSCMLNCSGADSIHIDYVAQSEQSINTYIINTVWIEESDHCVLTRL